MASNNQNDSNSGNGMVFNNPTGHPAPYVPEGNSGSSTIVRLVEDPDIPKTIKFDEISLEGTEDNANVNSGNSRMGELGLTYPMIRINDTILAKKNISSMKISMSGFMPTISLTLIFEDEVFISKNPPKDGDMISLFIRTDSNAMQYLRDEFIITSCKTRKGSFGNNSSTIILGGRLFIPGFDSKINTRGFTGSTKSVMKDIAKIYGIGFAFNDFDDTNDFQTWIQCKETTESFVNSMTLHSWKNSTSFFNSWVDLYYNLCYVNVNKFLDSTENDETIDLTFFTNTLYLYNQVRMDTSVGNATIFPKLFTNSIEFNDSPFFISKWEPINNSTSISMYNGYSTIAHTYLHNQNLINSDDRKCFSSLEIVPTYDQTKTDGAILLRGRSKYDKNKNPNDEMARVNYDFVNTYINNEWTGVEYVLGDDDDRKDSRNWTGNVHKNYNNAPYHNIQNINEINKIYLIIEVQGLCLQTMKGERVPVIIIFNNSITREKYNNFSENDLDSNINRFYTGYYIVDSVEYEFTPIIREDAASPYLTRFILKRREWPTPEAI